ncbi:MAG: YqjF family protein [Verrucomicrobiales bacterium]
MTEQRPVMYQQWQQLLFYHWSIEAVQVQKTLPPGLEVETYDDMAWIGVVPFVMKNVRPRGFPAVPWLSHFLELNVRTYVKTSAGLSGVWFYSLDCNQPIAVEIARRGFHLNYRHSQMQLEKGAKTLKYISRLRGEKQASSIEGQTSDSQAAAVPGSLEEFLVERYVLFSADKRGRLYSGRVSHAPYQIALVTSSCQVEDTPAKEFFPELEGSPTHCCFSPGVQVEILGLEGLDQPLD